MQIYTKILLGMVVGALIGIFLGPNSVLLTHDVYKVTNAANIHLRLDHTDPSTEVKLPANVPLRLTAVNTLTQSQVDNLDRSHAVPTWVQVRFPFHRLLALHDPTEALRQRLGATKTGDTVQGWLRIESEPLPDGGFKLSQLPVSGLGDTIIAWLSPIGKIFLRLIQMVIIPLVFASLLVGVASLGDVRKLGRLGLKTLGLYLLTTTVAVTVGLVCAQTIQPGTFIHTADRATLLAQFGAAADARVAAAAVAPTIGDTLLAIIPINPVASLAQGDMLQVIFFAVLFGVALTTLGSEISTPVINIFEVVQQAMIVLIHMVMALAPFGVAALIAEVVGMSGLSVLKALLVYSVTVLIGLAIHAGVIYGGLVQSFGQVSWFNFMRAARPAQLIAFSTSSSSATLPVTMECAQKNLGVSREVSSFVIPLGSTINMDGTALYQGVAAVFIAQVFHMDLSLGAQLSIVLMATVASIGAAGVPGAGMVTLTMVLTATGVPTVGLALILGVDRLLDMFRSAVNVTGDLAVATVMALSEGEHPTPSISLSAVKRADVE
jgi:proton glutamate symport protein